MVYQSGKYGPAKESKPFSQATGYAKGEAKPITNPNQMFQGSSGTKVRAQTPEGDTAVTFGSSESGQLGQAETIIVESNKNKQIKEQQQKEQEKLANQIYANLTKQQEVNKPKFSEEALYQQTHSYAIEEENRLKEYRNQQRVMGYESPKQEQSVYYKGAGLSEERFKEIQREEQAKKIIEQERNRLPVKEVKVDLSAKIPFNPKQVETTKEKTKTEVFQEKAETALYSRFEEKKKEYEEAGTNFLIEKQKGKTKKYEEVMLGAGYAGLTFTSGVVKGFTQPIIHPIKTVKGTYMWTFGSFFNPEEYDVMVAETGKYIVTRPFEFAGNIVGTSLLFKGISKLITAAKTYQFEETIKELESEYPKYEYKVTKKSPGYNLPEKIYIEERNGGLVAKRINERQLTIQTKDNFIIDIESEMDITKYINQPEGKIPNIEKVTRQKELFDYNFAEITRKLEPSKEIKPTFTKSVSQAQLKNYPMQTQSNFFLFEEDIEGPPSFITRLLKSKKGEFNTEQLTIFRRQQEEGATGIFSKLSSKLKGETEVSAITEKFTGKNAIRVSPEILIPLVVAGNYPSQKESTIQNNIISPKTQPTIRTRVELRERTYVMPKQFQLSKSYTKTEVMPKQIQITRQQARQITQQRQEAVQIQQTSQITQQLQMQMQKTQLMQKTIAIQKNVPQMLELRQKLKPPSPFIPKQGERKQRQGIFKVSVRRKGVFREIGEMPTFQAAFTKGAMAVKQTAAASFKVTGKQEGVMMPREFYPSKKEKGVFIQRNVFRISSPGEKKEIPGKAKMMNIFGRR